ncbi:MAG: IS200/IS605 family transposase [Planctomycetes bacterium]|nr:IS200/IS605 family transposase [Planctomycetota bacterium]
MGHTYASILLHVVFSAKDRQRSIEESFRQRLYEYMAGVARGEFGRALAIGGTADHVHALLSIGTDLSVGEVMGKWKGLSSGWVHKTVPAAKAFGWQAGYAAFSVSPSSAQRVVRYIAGQVEHHKRQTFEDELRLLLDRHGIAYDPQHLWA